MRTNYYFLIGIICLFGAMALFGKNMVENSRAEAASRKVVNQLEKEKDKTYQGKYRENPKMEMPVEMLDGNTYVGRLKIPSLDLDLPILSAWSNDAIRLFPARFQGSIYENNLIILAHNYRSHFGKIHRLKKGDLVIFFDIDQNKFIYQVNRKEVIKGTDLNRLPSNDQGLSLFTCTLGGQSRLVVRCKLIEE